jgi:arabinan endo-1,5-alpha-L-arabinosidase
MKSNIFIILILFPCNIFAQQNPTNISVHDPVIIKQDSMYYIFCTGRGINVWSSKNMAAWKKEKPVFDTLPWAVQAVKGFTNHIWAPDISYYNGLYYLYYSISAFGKNTSCIGVATNKTLHPSSPDFKWIDHGKVIQSYPGKTNWNAIDPNIISDNKGNAWMSFGSFWDGLKLIALSKNRLHTIGDTINLPTIASRKKFSSPDNPPSVEDNPKDAGGNAIEAPFIFHKNDYYYLFASIDYCCKGVKSTYKMIVGRSKKITGPFMDKDGMDMANDGGTILLQGDNNWYGVGHNAVASFDGVDYVVFHGYDAKDNGRPKLRIEKLSWEKGWPEVMQQ